ncbi:MAG: YceI family protein, partial [Thermoflexales bacterium]|nr:YceI family protein [Thermoflexales bacterium]
MAWTIDFAHSSITFAVRHLMISTVRGRFEKFSGHVDFNEAQPEKTSAVIEIAADSINTDDPQRDAHLKSPDFLDVANHPTIAFKSTRVERTGENTARMHGELTIRNTTRPVVLDVEFLGKARTPWGTTNAGFEAHTTLNREEWGLTWNMPLETGGLLVGKEVKINISLE